MAKAKETRITESREWARKENHGECPWLPME